MEEFLCWIPGRNPLTLHAPGMTGVVVFWRSIGELYGMERQFWVYIVASARNGTLYIGVTNDLGRRVFEHRTKAAPGFTARYNVSQLVWYEAHGTITEAIAREKQLKRWERAWKLKLIEDFNPDWRDLYEDLNG